MPPSRPPPRSPASPRPRPAPSPAPRSGPRRSLPTGEDLADEALRQAEAEAMRYGPFQDLRRLWFRYQAGSLLQPRYIVAALFTVASGLFVTCSGILTWLWAHR